MMAWIWATTVDGERIYLNLERCEGMGRDLKNRHTILVYGNDTLTVQESPEEILRRAWVEVEEVSDDE